MKKLHLIVSLFSLSILLSRCGSSGAGSSADVEYTAVGASDAVGIGATPLTNGYVYLIEEGIEQSGREVELENLGIPGAEIGDIDNIETFFVDLDEPELVTLFTGANDLIDGDDVNMFEMDLQGLLNKLRDGAEPGALIVVANLPDLTRLPRFVEEPDVDVTLERVNAFNVAIERQTSAANGLLVDLNSIAFSGSLTSDEDGFHPNDAGHRVVADAFLNVILPNLPQPE